MGQHLFREWHGAQQALSHYLNQWWPKLLAYINITGPRWVNGECWWFGACQNHVGLCFVLTWTLRWQVQWENRECDNSVSSGRNYESNWWFGGVPYVEILQFDRVAKYFFSNQQLEMVVSVLMSEYFGRTIFCPLQPWLFALPAAMILTRENGDVLTGFNLLTCH